MFYSPFFARISTSYCSGFEEPKARIFPSEKWLAEKRKCPSPSDTFLRFPLPRGTFSRFSFQAAAADCFASAAPLPAPALSLLWRTDLSVERDT